MTTVDETAVLVGELAADPVTDRYEAPPDWNTEDGAITVGRMAGVLLLNDGGTGGWLPTDQFGVRLAHDGAAWAVTFLSPHAWWQRKHAYRLSTGVLPMRDGSTVALEPGVVYEIRHDWRGYRDVWDLFRTTPS